MGGTADNPIKVEWRKEFDAAASASEGTQPDYLPAADQGLNGAAATARGGGGGVNMGWSPAGSQVWDTEEAAVSAVAQIQQDAAAAVAEAEAARDAAAAEAAAATGRAAGACTRPLFGST